jgi:hypothetical protein
MIETEYEKRQEAWHKAEDQRDSTIREEIAAYCGDAISTESGRTTLGDSIDAKYRLRDTRTGKEFEIIDIRRLAIPGLRESIRQQLASCH